MWHQRVNWPKLPCYSKDINKSREDAKEMLKAAGAKDLKFKLLYHNIAEALYTGRGGSHALSKISNLKKGEVFEGTCASPSTT